MIDLHTHILPGIDDGAFDLEVSIEMARLAVADGTIVLACTPHIKPSVYENSAAQIVKATEELQLELERHEIPLRLVTGADIHICDSMAKRLKTGSAPTIGGTRYFLFEPPHHVMPPGLLPFALEIANEGYVPILTHPERLTWIERQYDVICEMSEAGIALQITAGSLTGSFGKRAKYWSERLLDENRVDIIASDAHSAKRRSPGLSLARDHVAKRLGEQEALKLVDSNPAKILRDEPLPSKRKHKGSPKSSAKSALLRALGMG